ncbi:hypothetical protein H0H81_011251, partial [Sphagnurus paluster]
KIWKAEIHLINVCKAGNLPDLYDDDEDEEEEEDKPTPPSSPEDPALEEGDCIFATGLLPEPEYIHASSTISQCLAETFKQNSKLMDFEKHVPEHL